MSVVAPEQASRVFCAERDRAARERYLAAALPQIPRLIGAMDRNPFHRTYGCLDRQYWHYRTGDFPSEMYQEGVLPLALVYRHELPGNRWHGREQVREWAVAAMRFAARSCHKDGSCDDYYPYERALGAAVFSLAAAAKAYRTLALDDAEILAWLRLRATWIAQHDEAGCLTNHHALAALGLLQVARITGQTEFVDAAERKLRQVLSWQSDEGWFNEYGGADPGYQTVTIDCLAQCRRLLDVPWLDEPLRRATAFARWFLHPDDSFAGEYGSRGTHHFYPHGMELLAAEDASAADLADGFLRAVAAGKQAYFDDDRLFAHRLGNLLQAYLDWSPTRAAPGTTAGPSAVEETPRVKLFAQAGLIVRRDSSSHTVVSAARGGVFKHFPADGEPITDAGLVVELEDGTIAVSQLHDLRQKFDWPRMEANDESRMTNDEEGDGWSSKTLAFAVHAPLRYARHEVATPLKLAVFRLGLLSVGRCFRTLVRRLLQRRLITGHREAPITLTRRFDFVEGTAPRYARTSGCILRVTDLIELADESTRVRRMRLGVDHQCAYTAAAGVYQDGALAPWIDLTGYVDELNRKRKVTIVREYPCS